MPIPTHLLERAHQLISANQLQNAELVLDAVVRGDPQNVKAWMTYLQIHQNQNDLDWLKERVLKTNELNETDKTILVTYYHNLTQHLNGSKEATLWTDTFSCLQDEEQEETPAADERIVRFEFIDIFDYPSRIVNLAPRIRPRRRVNSSNLAYDIAKNALKAMLRSPHWEKIAGYIQNIITLTNVFFTNWKDAYIKYSKLPHFENLAGTALLTIFILGVRLVVLDYYIGYIILGMFILGGGWWLSNFGNFGTGQYRVFQHGNKIILPKIIKADIDQNMKPDNGIIEHKME